MVTKIHRDALKSEIATLRNMLARSGATRDRLGSMSLQQRLSSLEGKLAEVEGQVRNIANVALIFDGGPVHGSTAIDAEFAGKALQEYQDLIAKNVASEALGGLAKKGPLPAQQQQQARMNVTALVHGSFGFVLEENDPEQWQMFESPAMISVAAVTDLLAGVASSDGRWFDERILELDVRVFESLRVFVEHLHKAKSTLKIAEENREIRLDAAGVFRAHERVSQAEVKEYDEEIEGELLGLVPIQRRFDFRRRDDSEVLSGMVSVYLSADYLERIERDELVSGREWRAVVRTKIVQRPDGRRSETRTLIDLVKIGRPDPPAAA